MEAVYNVVGEKDESTESKLEEEAEAQITEAIQEGVMRELKEATAQAATTTENGDVEFTEGELNFARQVVDDDIQGIILENAILADYGPYLNDCLCANGTRSDYAKCVPKDETVHVSRV